MILKPLGRHIAPAVLAALLSAAFLSCADSILDTEPIHDRFGADGTAYINVSLALPDDDASTRAATFGDGDPKEYDINDAVVIIFGASTATPTPEQLTFRAVSKIFPFDQTITPTSDRITQAHTKVIRLSKDNVRPTDHLFAFALVNGTHYKADEAANTIYFNDYLEGGETKYRYTFSATTGNTFKTLMDIKNSDLRSEGYFTMTNAPMANQGRDDYDEGTIAITYLPEILSSKIYGTEQEAKENPATVINVERFAVKLTLKGEQEAGKMDGKLTTDNTIKYDYGNIYWCPDKQRNTQCYTVRHVTTSYLGYKAQTTAKGTTPTLRFLDDTPTSAGLYRIHWGEDFNYDYTTSDDSRETLDGLSAGPNNTQYFFGDAKIDGSFYWFENTMNELGLTQARTTRLLIRIPFIAGQDAGGNDVINESFYTLSNVGEDIIFLCDGKVRYYKDNEPEEATVATQVAEKTGHTVQEKVLEYVSSLSSFIEWRNSLSATAKTLSVAQLLNVTMFNGVQGQPGAPYQLPAYGKAKVLLSLNTSNVTDAADQEKFKAAFCSTATDYQGYATYEDGGGTLYFHYENDLDRQVNNDITFNFYDHGMAYYKVLVRHFGDDEVAAYVSDQGSSYDKVYPAANRAQNYLGRYGMVRNTWYTITLTGVRHIGYSDDVPLPQDTPDDEVDNYLSVKVLVNKWAQRGQTNTL